MSVQDNAKNKKELLQQQRAETAAKLLAKKTTAPIQEVRPVAPPQAEKEEEKQLNVNIPKTLFREVKAYAANQDLSIKDVTRIALEKLLKG